MQLVTPNEVEHLLAFLKEADQKIDRQEWTESLSKRKREEMEFHDRARNVELKVPDKVNQWEKDHGNKKFYETAQESFEYSQRWIRNNAPGRIFLDYACGEGVNAMLAAEAGAALSIGIDISPISIENCRQTAAERGLDKNTYFLVGDCDNTGLPDNSVDSIICMGCLHHFDLSYAFPEMRRILKPNGRIYVNEALAYNPLIQIYRRFTPHLRTSFEKDHILSLREVKFASYFFKVENIRFFHLFSIATTPFRKSKWFTKVLKMANAIDGAVLQIPPFSYLAWQFSFELVKRVNS